MMNFSVSGDWHGDVHTAAYAIREAYDAQSSVLIQVGDFGIFPNHQGFVKFVDTVSAFSVRYGVQTWFIRGNHDDPGYCNTLPKDSRGLGILAEGVFYIPDGYRWEWDGITFAALGGAVSLDRARRIEGHSYWRNETIDYSAALELVSGGPIDVLITHDAPLSLNIPGLPPRSMWPNDALVSSDENRKLLEEFMEQIRPRRHFCGHFHVREDLTHAYSDGSVCHTSVIDADGSRGFIVHLDTESILG